MPKLTDDLAMLYSQYVVRQSKDLRTRCRQSNREYSRKIDRLAKQGILTVADLIAQLPCLSPGMKYFGIQLISRLKLRQAIPVLLELLDGRALRVACADALCRMNAGRKVTQLFIQIGRRELESEKPDRHWLEAVIYGLGCSSDPGAADLLVSIFERVDLPGWIRGDAGDKLGCVEIVHDRRTHLFRRCRDAALRGITEDSIEVQFWSMYVISTLCSDTHRRTPLRGLESALPILRRIAANDHRLAPGYWWPMSAEAEDVLACFESGQGPDLEAAERWAGNTQRGEYIRD